MRNGLIILILVTACGYALYRWQPWVGSGEAAPTERVQAATVAEKRSIRFSVSAAGDIGPAEQVSVRPEVNGRIAELRVDIGDTVSKDELLFTLDDRELQIERESVEKEVERARLQQEQAERDYERSKGLYESGLVSAEVYEQSRTAFELARNALERTQKNLDLVQDRLRKTRIGAPFDCTVLTRPVSVGQAVSGSGGYNSGTEVLTIADLHEMVINAHINQADVTRLQVAQQVEVSVEAVSGLTATGVVERIAPQATIKNGIKGFAARVLLRDVDPRVRPGMTANIKIPVASADDVVAVPLSSVFTDIDPETGEADRYVYVKAGSGWERRPVVLGVSDYFVAEIQSGIEAGETVATQMPTNLVGQAASGGKAPSGS